MQRLVILFSLLLWTTAFAGEPASSPAHIIHVGGNVQNSGKWPLNGVTTAWAVLEMAGGQKERGGYGVVVSRPGENRGSVEYTHSLWSLPMEEQERIMKSIRVHTDDVVFFLSAPQNPPARNAPAFEPTRLVTVAGSVMRPGQVPVDGGSNVWSVLAECGGPGRLWSGKFYVSRVESALLSVRFFFSRRDLPRDTELQKFLETVKVKAGDQVFFQENIGI